MRLCCRKEDSPTPEERVDSERVSDADSLPHDRGFPQQSGAAAPDVPLLEGSSKPFLQNLASPAVWSSKILHLFI
jgi:hypothetical protein